MRKLLVLFSLVFPLLVKAQYCPVNGSDVYLFHWSPSKGSIARYTAAILDTSTGRGTMIVLGQDSLGIYTIEAGLENDASGCRYAYLAVTGFNGNRKTYSIYDGQWMEPWMDTDSLRPKVQERVLGRIWKFCSDKVLVPAQLKPIRAHKSAEGNISVQLNGNSLSWHVATESSMCWCFFKWEFYKQ